MNQSFGDRMSPPGTLTLVKNSRIRGTGGLTKRCGSAAIASTDAETRTVADTVAFPRPTEKASFVSRLGDQSIAAASSGWAFGWSGTRWQYLASVSAASPVRKRFGISPSLPTRPVGPYVPGCATNAAGYICTAAGFGPELKISVESPDGELLYSTTETVGAAGIVVRVVAAAPSAASALFYVLYQATDGTTVTRRTIITSSSDGVTALSTATQVTLANASSTWDVSYYDGTTWFIVYQSGATTVTVAEYTAAQTPVVGSTATFATTNNLTYLSLWADSVTDRVWVGVLDDPTGTPVAQYRIYTDALVLSVGPTTFTLSGAGVTGVPLFGPLYVRSPVAGDAFFVYAFTSAAPARKDLIAGCIQSGVQTRGVSQAVGVVPISKPDAQQRVWCMTYGSGANFQTAKVLLLRCISSEFIGLASADPSAVIELASPDMEAMASANHPASAPGVAFHSSSVTSESAGGNAVFALPFVLTSRTSASSAIEATTRVDVYEYTRYNQEPHRQMVATGRAGYVTGQPTELYGVLVVNSGGLAMQGGVEVGFAFPPVMQAPTTTPSGSGLAAGDYVYYCLWQWVDDEGNRHLSEPSAPTALTLTVPSSVEIRVPNFIVGQRPNTHAPTGAENPTPFLYRTQNGGTEAQQVPIVATESGTSSTFTDTVADTIIDDNEFIYTAGGVLPNVLAPSCRYLAVSEERLWCGGLWDSNIIECSKVRVSGEPYNFTGDPSHQVVVPGEVSGLAYMDGQVVAFTEDAIYLVSGDGPNDQGAGGFAPPRALVRGVGCPRSLSPSILETEIGILFRSTLGFYVIPRGFGTPQYIGGAVQDEDAVVLSAATTTTSEHRLARFLVCASGETKSDTVLTLDLTSMQWFRDEYTVNGSVTGQGFAEIGEWPDGLALMSYGLDRTDNASIIWAENESLTGDAGATGAGASTYISQYARTAWIYPWGPLGVGRLTEVVFSMEAIGSSSVVTVSVETDLNTAHAPFWTIATSQSVSYRSAAPPEPECTCFRVTISDAAGAANSAGIRMLALGFETASPGGIRRVTDTERQ